MTTERQLRAGAVFSAFEPTPCIPRRGKKPGARSYVGWFSGGSRTPSVGGAARIVSHDDRLLGEQERIRPEHRRGT